MNKINNKFLLAGDIFMTKLGPRKLGFTYSVCGPFTKQGERIKKKSEKQVN